MCIGFLGWIPLARAEHVYDVSASYTTSFIFGGKVRKILLASPHFVCRQEGDAAIVRCKKPTNQVSSLHVRYGDGDHQKTFVALIRGVPEGPSQYQISGTTALPSKTKQHPTGGLKASKKQALYRHGVIKSWGKALLIDCSYTKTHLILHCWLKNRCSVPLVLTNFTFAYQTLVGRFFKKRLSKPVALLEGPVSIEIQPYSEAYHAFCLPLFKPNGGLQVTLEEDDESGNRAFDFFVPTGTLLKV